MSNVVQRILIRSDLDLPMGLMAAQVAHIHMQGVRNLLNNSNKNPKRDSATISYSDFGVYGADLEEWLKEPYLFVHKVPCLEILDFFHTEFQKAKIPVCEWKDTITINISPTQKKAFPLMKIGIAIGPCDSDKIKAIISDLPLL